MTYTKKNTINKLKEYLLKEAPERSCDIEDEDCISCGA